MEECFRTHSFCSTCTSGQWSCGQLDCSRTCSILRNTHYTTFSGQYLKIHSGVCEYTAARFKKDPKRFDLTLSNNASAEHGHSLKGRLSIDGTDSTRSCRFSETTVSVWIGITISLESGKPITVDNKALTTLGSSPARYPSFTIYKAGIFVVINATRFNLRWDTGKGWSSHQQMRYKWFHFLR